MSSYVVQALGHGSDAVTKRHYIAPLGLDSIRSSRAVSTLIGKLSRQGLIAYLRTLPSDELDSVCAALGFRR